MERANLIDGAWVPSSKTYTRENPANPQEIAGVYPLAGAEEASAALDAAKRAYPQWRDTNPIQRGRILHQAADLLEKGLPQVARDIAIESGKPIGEVKPEVQRTIGILRYYAAYAFQPQGHMFASGRERTRLSAQCVPLGVTALITPWNFPIAIPTWKLAPALIKGNTVVLKPSSLGPAGALHLADALKSAGLPHGVLNVVIGPGTPFGQVISQARDIKAISFTGSAEVGLQLKADLARSLARVQLELGGTAGSLWRVCLCRTEMHSHEPAACP